MPAIALEAPTDRCDAMATTGDDVIEILTRSRSFSLICTQKKLFRDRRESLKKHLFTTRILRKLIFGGACCALGPWHCFISSLEPHELTLKLIVRYLEAAGS